ncbi:hypothetical protein, partial [Paenibacillus elgii]|uniref:hypothetical protein n=1 Tax=Paenibacillus elgii TaxID=189691 RepID=UPI000248C439
QPLLQLSSFSASERFFKGKSDILAIEECNFGQSILALIEVFYKKEYKCFAETKIIIKIYRIHCEAR